jgi:hypothetical protein
MASRALALKRRAVHCSLNGEQSMASNGEHFTVLEIASRSLLSTGIDWQVFISFVVNLLMAHIYTYI